jgi:hypothetical protein
LSSDSIQRTLSRERSLLPMSFKLRPFELCLSSSAKFRGLAKPLAHVGDFVPAGAARRDPFPSERCTAGKGALILRGAADPCPASTVLVSGKTQTAAQARNKIVPAGELRASRGNPPHLFFLVLL